MRVSRSRSSPDRAQQCQLRASFDDLSRKLVRDLRHSEWLHHCMHPLTGLVAIADVRRSRRRYQSLSVQDFAAVVNCSSNRRGGSERLILAGDQIGARNGHSFDGIIGISEVATCLPVILLHWTRDSFLTSIMEHGILPTTRAVHLVVPSGRRPSGATVSVQVDTRAALREGVIFRQYSDTSYTVWQQDGDHYRWMFLSANCIHCPSLNSGGSNSLSVWRSSCSREAVELAFEEPSSSSSTVGRSCTAYVESVWTERTSSSSGQRVGVDGAFHGFYRGCYVQQTIRRVPGMSKLPWYAHPPSLEIRERLSFMGVDAGTIFGPVHAIEDTRLTLGFVSVLVPCPRDSPSDYTGMSHSTFWINVSKGSLSWCRLVPHDVVRSWEKRGWRHWLWPRAHDADICPNCRDSHGEHCSGTVLECGCCAGTCDICLCHE